MKTKALLSLLLVSQLFINSCVAWPVAIIAGAAAGSQSGKGGQDMTFLALFGLGGQKVKEPDPEKEAVNRAPSASNIVEVLTKNNESRSLNLIATDPDGDSLTYTITRMPDNGSLTGSGASWIYNGPAVPNLTPDYFKFKASDGKLESEEASVSILRLAFSPDPLNIDESSGSRSLSASLIYPAAGYAAGQTGAGGGLIADNAGVLTENISSAVVWNNNGAPVTIDASGNITVDPGASPGDYTIIANISAGSINLSQTFAITINPDTSAPGAPIVGTAGTTPTPTNNVYPTWHWLSAGGPNASGTYRYRLNNSNLTAGATQVTSGTGGSFTSTNVLSEGNHTLYVQEKSSSTSAWSATGFYTITVDLTPPNAPTVGTAGTTASPTNNATPTWHWLSGGGGGNGNYRVQLNSETGAWTNVGAVNSWTSSALSHGTHTLYVQERDAAGNWSPSGSYAIVVDLVPPAAPVVGTAGTTVSPTNDTTPTWHWTSGGGDGTGNYRYNVNGGSWFNTTATSYTPGSAWSDGTYTLYVQERDAVGNWSSSGLHTIVIDTAAPAGYAVSIDQTGYINSSNQTNMSFTFSGAEVGATYYYTVTSSGGGSIGPFSGTVSAPDMTVSGINVSGLADGTLTLSVYLRDAAGNQGSTVSDTITKDTTPPAAPGVPDLTAGSDSGISDTDNITKYTILDFNVSCENGNTVQLFSNGVQTGMPAVCSGGSVTLTTGVLSHGVRSITARQTDPAGNQGAASAALNVTVDTVAPSSVTALSLVGGDAEIAMSWTNPADSDFAATLIRYKTGSHPVSPTDGNPAYEGTANSHILTGLVNGTTYYFSAYAYDTAGNYALVTQGSAKPSVDVNVNLSTTAANPTNISPIPVTITFSHAMYSNVAGCTSGGGETQDFTVNDIIVTNGTKGALAKGASCAVFTINITPSGQGAVTIDVPADAAYAFGTANFNHAASQLSITYDTVPPNAPVVSGTAVTNNTTPPWNWSSGGGGGNGIYRYQLNSESAGGWSAPTTATLYVPSSALSEGTHTLYVQERDAAGNWSASGSFAITVDTTAPALAITSPNAMTPVNGSAVITFTGSEGSTQASADGGITWTAVSSGFAVSEAGGWDSVPEGTFTLMLRETDAAGNTATASRSFIKDTIAPVFSSVMPSSSTVVNHKKVSYTLSENLSSGTITWTRTGGSADPSSPHVMSLTGAELQFGLHNDILIANSPDLVDGAVYTISFNGTDAAGNVATTVNRINITYDVTAPVITVSAPVNGAYVNHVRLSYHLSEALASGTVTWTRTGGAADPSSPHVKTMSASDRSPGSHNNWSLADSPTLTDGAVYTITFNGSDAAGNTAATVTITGVTYDITPPSNQNAVFTASVIAKGGTPISINSSGSALNTVWFAPAGLTTADIAQFVADATHTSAGGTATSILAPANEGIYHLYVIDAAGNVSPQSVATLTVDNTAPSVTVNQKTGQLDPASDLPIEFTIVFSEAINPATFDVSDITQNGTASGITWSLTTSDNITWNLAATAIASQGTVIPTIASGRVADIAGNLNAASTSTDNSVTFAPVLYVTINRNPSQPSRTNALPVVFDVVFSYPIADGNFTASDITQTTGTGYATGVTWSVTKVTATQYTVSATASGQGILKPYIQANVVPENNQPSTSTDNEVVYELVKPNVTVNQSSGQADPTNTNPISFTIVFSEPINPATFTASDFTKSGTASFTLAEPVTSDNVTWTVQATASTEGTVIISLPANAVSDLAGNTSNASTSTDNTVTYDITPPVAVINGAPTGINNIASLNVTISGTDVVSYRYALFDSNDGPTSCANAVYNGSDIPVSVAITDSLTGKDDGTITLCVRGKDQAGNLMPAASASVATWTKDSTAANVTISGQPTGTNNITSLNITVSPTSGETHYQYKIVSGTSCSVGSYSSNVSISTPITDSIAALPDGNVTVCVIGYKNPSYQTTPTSATWIKKTVPPAVVSAETVDKNGNGKIDGIKITFASEVDATTFPGYNSGNPVATTQWIVGSYTNVKLDLSMGDTLNDAIIYLSFNENTGFCDATDQTGCDTGNKPDVTTTASPGLKDIYGNTIAQISTATIAEADGAKPVIVGASPPSNITLQVYFSEIVTAATAECGAGSSRPSVDCSTIYSITGGLSVSKAVMSNGVGVNSRIVVLTTSEQVHNQSYTVTASTDIIKDVNNLTNVSPYNAANFLGAPPTTNLVSAVAINNTTVELTFNVVVTSASAQNAARYTIPGLTVTAANMYPTPGTNSNKVRLTTSSHLSNTPNGYTVTVQSGQISAEASGLTCNSPNNTASFTGDTLPEVQSVASLNEFAVDVIFSEYVLMDTSANGALNPANYVITGSPAGLSVTAVEQLSNTKVRLTTSSQVLDRFYTLTVSNVRDITTPVGNTISPTARTGNFLGRENLKILSARRVYDYSSAFNVFQVTFSKPLIFEYDSGSNINAADRIANWSFPSGLGTVSLCTASDDAACPIGYTSGVDTVVYFKASPEPAFGAYTVVGKSSGSNCILPHGGIAPTGCLKPNPDDRASVDFGLPVVITDGPVYNDPFNDNVTVAGQVILYNNKLIIGPNNVNAGIFQTDINMSNATSVIFDADEFTSGFQPFDANLWESCADGGGTWPNCTSGTRISGVDYMYAGCYSSDGSVDTTLTGLACSQAGGTEYLFVLGYKTNAAQGYQTSWVSTSKTSPFIFKRIAPLSRFTDLTYRSMSVLIFKGWVFQASQHQSGSYAPRWSRFKPDDGTIFRSEVSGSDQSDLGGRFLWRIGESSDNGKMANGQGPISTGLISIDSMFEYDNDGAGGNPSQFYIANGGSLRWWSRPLTYRFRYLTGTVSAASGQRILTGTGTKFTTEMEVGQAICVLGQACKTVDQINSDTNLRVSTDWSPAVSNQKATIPFVDGGVLRSVAGLTGANLNNCTSATNCNTMWEDVTPDHEHWNRYMSIPLPQDAKAGGDWDFLIPSNKITPAIKAIPKMVSFNGNLFLIRNACATVDYSYVLTGTVSGSAGSTTLTGSGTVFTSPGDARGIRVGDQICVRNVSNGTVQCRTVTSIASNTSLTVNSAWTSNIAAGSKASRGDFIYTGKVCPAGSERPQLWKLPANSGNAASARAAWTFIGNNSDFTTRMSGAYWSDGIAQSQATKTAANTEITLLVVNGNRLYVGFDNAQYGANIWRTRAGVTNPSSEADFEAVCDTGNACFNSARQFGFGMGTANSRLFDSTSVNDAGTDYLIFNTGDGINPFKIYRSSNF